MAFSDIMSIFRPAPPTPAPAPIPTGTQNPGAPMPGTQGSEQTAPNGVIPTQTEGNNKEVSPLDAHKDIWQSPAKPEGSESTEIFAGMDPKKVMESAGKIDFARVITPEILAKVQAGGADASQAFAAALNSVAQTVYGQSAIATTKIVEQALAKQAEQFNAQMPTMVKKFSANENLLSENPLLRNPAIQPLVGALQEQLIRKNPNATSAEIQQQVNDYFSALGTTFAPKPPADPKAKAKAASEDWSSFF